LTTGWMFVYTIQPVVKPVVQLVPVLQPVVSCERGIRLPLPSSRQCLSDDDCQGDRREDIGTVLYCIVY